MTTEAGAEALQESTLADELVESTTIEELESTVTTECDGVVAEEIIVDLSSPKPGHTTGGSRRGARRGGGAGSGRTVCQQNCEDDPERFQGGGF